MLTPQKLEPMLCRTKLVNYCLYIEKKKAIKQDKSPLFFRDNSNLLLDIDEKLTAVKKVIELLSGNDEIEFNQEEAVLLNKGFIGDTLTKYNVSLLGKVDDEVNTSPSINRAL